MSDSDYPNLKVVQKPNVLIAVPTGDGWISHGVVSRLIEMTHDDRFGRRDVYMSIRKPCEANRNHICAAFLEGPYDWLLMVDDDNPPNRNSLDLAFLGLDIIGCPTPLWREESGNTPFRWNVYGPETLTGLSKVLAVGSGCILISRRVMKAIACPFSSTWLPNGTVRRGTDLAFCERALAEGFDVYVHWDYCCGHYKEIDLGRLIVAPSQNAALDETETADGTSPGALVDAS